MTATRRVPTAAFLLLGVIVCVGLDLGYDAMVAVDRSYKFWLHIGVICAVNVLSATALNVVNGMAGQFSIGHAGFVGLGAYLGGGLAARLALAMHTPLAALKDNLPIAQSLVIVPTVLVFVGAVSAVVGFVVGLPSLRLRGDYLAIVTLGFAEILRLTIVGTPEDTAQNPITQLIASLGGALGYRGVRVVDPATGIADFTGIPAVAGPLWTVGIPLLALFFALRLKRSGFGRALRAVREDEIAASAVGVDPARYKVIAFVVAAAGAGLAGALLAIQRDGSGLVSPAFMKFDKSFEVITMVILGGSGSVTGTAVGAILYTLVFYGSEELLNLAARGELMGVPKIEWLAHVDSAALRIALFAVALIGVMLLRPQGLFGEREVWERAKKKPSEPPSPNAAAPSARVAVGPS